MFRSQCITVIVGLLWSVSFVNPFARAADPPANDLPPPVQLTAQQDHQRIKELLKITSLRPGANPRDPNAPRVPADASVAFFYASLGLSAAAVVLFLWLIREPRGREHGDREKP